MAPDIIIMVDDVVDEEEDEDEVMEFIIESCAGAVAAAAMAMTAMQAPRPSFGRVEVMVCFFPANEISPRRAVLAEITLQRRRTLHACEKKSC
ncbi:MAG: hypothetical protein WDN06_02000 [Asticcacaulis sp.]